jgi:hypothetical protein
VAAFRGPGFAVCYIYRGRTVRIDTGRLGTGEIKAEWLDPRTGATIPAGVHQAGGLVPFTAPDGQDWVLVLRII